MCADCEEDRCVGDTINLYDLHAISSKAMPFFNQFKDLTLGLYYTSTSRRSK